MITEKSDIIKNEFTAYCGLYCRDCIRFQSKASKLAEKLIEEFNVKNYSKYSEIKKETAHEFKAYEACVSLLSTISQFSCDVPCRAGGDGCGGKCKIIQCVKEKTIAGCWECSIFENCNKLTFLKPMHQTSFMENLKLIKKHGIDNWEKHRKKCYPWDK